MKRAAVFILLGGLAALFYSAIAESSTYESFRYRFYSNKAWSSWSPYAPYPSTAEYLPACQEAAEVEGFVNARIEGTGTLCKADYPTVSGSKTASWDYRSVSCDAGQVPNDSGICGDPAPACEAGITKNAHGSLPRPGALCVGGCGYAFSGVGVEVAGEYYATATSTGASCTGETGAEATDPTSDNCFTKVDGRVVCDDDPTDNCGTINGQKVCVGPGGCGYINGQFYCSDFGNNCGTFNGERICVEPEGGDNTDGCIVGADGSKVCIGDTKQTNTETITTDNGDGTTTTTTTTTANDGTETTTTTTSDGQGNSETETKEEGTEEPKFSAPTEGEGEDKAQGALDGTGIGGFGDGIGGEGGQAADALSFGFTIGGGGQCQGIPWAYKGESGTWDSWCSSWDGWVRPALAWFFYLLTAMGIYHAWIVATRV